MGETLFLAHRIPYPPDRGDKIRSWHLLKHLAARGRCHLACFADDEQDAANLPALRAALGERLGEAMVVVRRKSRLRAAAEALATRRPISLAAFDDGVLRAFVIDILRRRPIDALFVFSGQMAQFVPEGRPFVMDFVDMDSAKFAAYAAASGGLMHWAHRREARRLFACERQTAARAATSLFVSEAEAALFRHQAALPDADIRALSNGIDLDLFCPHAVAPVEEAGEKPLLVFTGQMDYRPNIDAVVHFAEAVLPLLPGVRFAIVGRNPAAKVRALASRNVAVTGAVSDIRAWIEAATVIVAPLRIARGIQNKVLEAMAMAKPVVASPAAFEGIDAVAGRDLLVADRPDAQADAIRVLLDDPARRAKIGRAARARMEAAYGWKARLAPLDDILGGGPERDAA